MPEPPIRRPVDAGGTVDLELTFWIVVLVGGYMLVLGYLLRIAMRKKVDGDVPPGGSGG
jgi:hypothetical protein